MKRKSSLLLIALLTISFIPSAQAEWRSTKAIKASAAALVTVACAYTAFETAGLGALTAAQEATYIIKYLSLNNLKMVMTSTMPSLLLDTAIITIAAKTGYTAFNYARQKIDSFNSDN